MTEQDVFFSFIFTCYHPICVNNNRRDQLSQYPNFVRQSLFELIISSLCFSYRVSWRTRECKINYRDVSNICVCVCSFVRNGKKKKRKIEEIGELFNVNVRLYNFCFYRHRQCLCNRYKVSLKQ